MKLIVGYLTAKPGKREAFLAAAQDHDEQSRQEPGCRYFELLPLPDHPDRMLLAEAFVSEAAHRTHEDTDHMRALWAVMPQMLVHASIDNVVSDAVVHDEDWFDQVPGPSVS
jgi:quinol monooxygenase YgiN